MNSLEMNSQGQQAAANQKKTEAYVLHSIQMLAVREENIMVARVTLHNLREDRDETIRSFGARLRGQANICKFSIKCPGCDIYVNFTDESMRDVLAMGIADPDIQMNLLSDKREDMPLEEVFQFVEAQEAGKRSASRLLDSHAVEAASSYMKNKNNRSDTCGYCGKTGHGRSAPARIRRNECPAYGNICELCNINHHLANMCRSKDKPKVNKNKAVWIHYARYQMWLIC